WCDTQRKWIGWERKRGKISSLMKYILKGKLDASYCIGDLARLRDAKYLVVLDEDSQITPECVDRLIGNHVHPLNHAHVDKMSHAVKRGYGILQPSISEMLQENYLATVESKGRDTFQAVFGETMFL